MSLSKSISLGILSNAFRKSTKQEYIFLPFLWHCICIRLCRIRCASDVLFPATNPNCSGLKMFLSRTNFSSLWFKMDEKSFPKQDRTDIPR